MANELFLNRINSFLGGITIAERDRRIGVGLNFEELDIFSNPNFIKPETILSDDTSSIPENTIDRMWGYTVDDSDNLYAITDDGAGTPKAKIIKLSSASVNNPGSFSAYKTSGQDARSLDAPTNIIWHGWGDPITTGHLYYITGTNSLYKYGDIKVTPSESSIGTLSGIDATDKYIPMIRASGEIFIGHGQFIAKIDDSGTFVEKAFTLPNEWICVDFEPIGNQLAILAKSIRTGYNTSRVFFWDMTTTTGVDDEVIVPMGGPEAIINHSETLRVFCVRDAILRIYELIGAVPTKTHELNVYNGTLGNQEFFLYHNSVFIKNNIVYFGLARGAASNASGLYALGRVSANSPLALVLAKRFTTTASATNSSHTPLAAIPVGPNIYTSYYHQVAGGSSNKVLRVEENNSPARSSNAIYESIWIDSDSPEKLKDWEGFMITTEALAHSNLKIKVDARVDNATSYNTTDAYDDSNNDALDDANDQVESNTTANTFWYRQFRSLVGRRFQIRLRFTSNTTNSVKLYDISILSRERNLL